MVKKKWTKEYCKKIAILCDNDRKIFRKKYPNGYNTLLKNRWDEEIFGTKRKKGNGYYSKELCAEIALTCFTRAEFKKINPCAYAAARTRGFLDEICAHMKNSRLHYPSGWWDVKEHVFSIGKQYSSKIDFKTGNVSAYEAALRHGWMEEISNNFENVTNNPKLYGKRTKTYVNEEQIILIASTYDSIEDFRENEPYLYEGARKLGIIERLALELYPSKYKPNEKEMTDEKAHTIALQYLYKKDFYAKERKVYRYARNKGIVKQITSHMKALDNSSKRCIYAAIFNDNYAYIGLTYKTTKRWADHMNPRRYSAVYEHGQETGLKPTFIQITDYMSANLAMKEEDRYIEIYKQLGYTMLNRVRGGALGSTRRRSKQSVLDSAKQFKYLKDFRLNCPKDYDYCARHKLQNELRKILIFGKPFKKIK